MSEFRPALLALHAFFEARGLRWYVFGAQAAIYYGRPRLTTDLDITFEAEMDQVPKLLKELSASGFSLRSGYPADFIEKTRVMPLEHEPSTFKVDLVIAGHGLELAFLANAQAIEIDERVVPFIAPEDLVVSKILAGRPQDLEDVVNVLVAQGKTLDIDRVRHWLDLVERTLDRSDLLSELRRAEERAGRS